MWLRVHYFSGGNLIIESGAVPLLISLLMSSKKDIQFEAATILTQVSCESSKYATVVLQSGGLTALVPFLNLKADREIVVLALKCVEALLGAGGEHALELFESVEGLDKVEELQRHSCETIYNKVVTILKLFDGDDEPCMTKNSKS